MKKTNSLSKNKFIIIVNLFLISILMVVGVYAWFASQANNRIDAYDVQVQSDSSLELSFDQKSWGGTLDLANFKETENGPNVLESMKFVEVTGDGSTFQIPQLTQKQTHAEVNTDPSVKWTTAVANQDYLKFTVYMRSKESLDIYLSSDSKASPASSVYTGENCGNKSAYATGTNAFSKDCIVGALRVAAKDDSNNQKFIWITNPEFHLDNTVGSSIYKMTTDATSTSFIDGEINYTENKDFYWNNPYEHYYYDDSRVLTKASEKDEINVITSIPNSIDEKPSDATTLLASLEGTKNEEGYYTSSVTFTVWIEGCDTEARRALVDGKFNLSLILDSFGK